jgi:aspartyl-tRNA(Asn)/glutamyl-tRNA(Gln) amidotransferase subunit A
MLDALARPDSRDPTALPEPPFGFLAALRSGVGGLRIAFSPDLGYVHVDPEVARAVSVAVGVLAELGGRVEEVDPGFSDPVETFHALWFTGAAQNVEHLDDEQRALLEPALLDICEQGRKLSALDYLRASAQRTALGTLMGRFHERFDLLVTPTTPITAFAAGVEVPPGSTGIRWTSWTPFSYPFNLTQQPAASVPCGLTADGLPVGLQLVGPRHGDATVLAAAKAYQDAAGPLPQRPRGTLGQ